MVWVTHGLGRGRLESGSKLNPIRVNVTYHPDGSISAHLHALDCSATLIPIELAAAVMGNAAAGRLSRASTTQSPGRVSQYAV